MLNTKKLLKIQVLVSLEQNNFEERNYITSFATGDQKRPDQTLNFADCFNQFDLLNQVTRFIFTNNIAAYVYLLWNHIIIVQFMSCLRNAASLISVVKVLVVARSEWLTTRYYNLSLTKIVLTWIKKKLVGTAKRTKSITIVISDTLICSSIENAPQPQTCSN